MNKQEIRIYIQKKYAQLTAQERQRKNSIIWRKLKKLPEFIKARIVMFYISRKDEVDTREMIEKTLQLGKQVAVPVVMSERDLNLIPSLLFHKVDDLGTGPWDIVQPKEEQLYPINPQMIDLVVVPGRAFDPKGNRLGRGKGYYDRFLSLLPSHTPTVGIAYDFQMMDSLPTTSSDIPVTKLLVA